MPNGNVTSGDIALNLMQHRQEDKKEIQDLKARVLQLEKDLKDLTNEYWDHIREEHKHVS